MKLSELVAYRNQIDMEIVNESKNRSQLELSKITHLVKTQEVQFENYTKTLEAQYDEIADKFDQFRDTFVKLKKELDQIISDTEKPYFSNSYKLYEEMTQCESDEYILGRRLSLSPETDVLIRARIKKYATWKHPAVIIRPGLENFIDDLVMFDPLYLVDQSYDLLYPAMQRFPEEYQRRLRPYVINESLDNLILEKLPNNQFGLCFAYNFFNFRPFELFKRYLEEIFQKLCAGGMFILTFNDCDREKAVMLAEMNYSCYTPGSLVISLAESIGYEVVFKYHDDGSWLWLELKKPGELTSLRGGQTLAKILPKQLEKSK